MNRRYVNIALAAAWLALTPAAAQTFQNYRCADGTQFIVAFYDDDSRAHLQLDGAAVALNKRLTLSGSRYSGHGVTLRMSDAGVTIRHAGRRVTACQLQ